VRLNCNHDTKIRKEDTHTAHFIPWMSNEFHFEISQ